MRLDDIDLNELSREEYINLILLIICSFKLDYEYFNDIEKDTIKNFLNLKLVNKEKKI